MDTELVARLRAVIPRLARVLNDTSTGEDLTPTQYSVLALVRGRDYVLPQDVVDVVPDVLRHRLVLSYDALSEGISADDILDRVLAAVEIPPSDHLRRRAAA